MFLNWNILFKLTDDWNISNSVEVALPVSFAVTLTARHIGRGIAEVTQTDMSRMM